jgi:hypothetical protein
MLHNDLFSLSKSRYSPQDAATQLWPLVKRLFDSSQTKQELKTRLAPMLVGMSLWADGSPIPSEAQDMEKLLTELPEPKKKETWETFQSNCNTCQCPMCKPKGLSNLELKENNEKEKDEDMTPSDESKPKTNLCDLLLSSLVDHSECSEEQIKSWARVIQELIPESSPLTNKRKQLEEMNPWRDENKQPQKRSKTDTGSRSSFMSIAWHPPPPIAQIFTEKRIKLLRFAMDDSDISIPTNAQEFHDLVEKLREKLQAGPAIRFKVDRKRRKNKVGSKAGRYNSLAPVFVQKGKLYSQHLALLGVLEGRLKQYVEGGGVRAEASLLDKRGVLDRVTLKKSLAADIPTALFVVLASLDFSARKAFTLDKQQQGGLNPYLGFFFKQLEAHSANVSWDLVFHIYPCENTLSRLSQEQKEHAFDLWTPQLPLLAQFLENQWNLGVKDCAQRNMLVARRGSKLDSDGWNRTAGAWNNAIRFIRLLAPSFPESRYNSVVLFKTLKLTAGDQMRWADSSGKGADQDTLIFKDLIDAQQEGQRSWLPWSGITHDTPGLKEQIQSLCNTYQVPIQKWLGRAQQRSSEQVNAHLPMICGVSISQMSIEQASILKSIGFAGSNVKDEK